jgi:hypothetical protein
MKNDTKLSCLDMRKLNSHLMSGINYDVIPTLNSDPIIANITFAIEERFRTSTDATAIQLGVMTLEYYCTFGALMVT